MTRDPRYDILFEPVRIGPKTAPNRFYQVPHCTGMGFRWPRTVAEMRGVKAEGGWGVVCTEECEIHPSSDLSGSALYRLWDDSDLPAHELMVRKVHEHGALAGLQLVHNGISALNRLSRIPVLAPSANAMIHHDPIQARAMTKDDIRDLRRWYREAALRGRKAGYDIIYVYAGHEMTMLMHFLLPRYNQRTDEYGGSLENRARLLREVLEETKDAVGGDCAVAIRLAVHEMTDSPLSYDAEGREVVEMLADLPDLWDVNIARWEDDSLTSRFGPEGAQEKFVSFVKQVTDKPVVGVGRFTSPDTMVSQVKRGVIDLIGSARPSIADPFLPRKIDDGREDEIRECIGCNICTTGDHDAVPIRCTQNATIGEEWRKGWHPERVEPKGSEDTMLIVGGGPAGLECALVLAKRGYDVALAEAGDALGGRVLVESRLPNLGEWMRVADHRIYMLGQKPNVETYTASELGVEEILEFGFARVVIATGAAWRSDGFGRTNRLGIAISDPARVVSPDAILKGRSLAGRVLVFDDDGYYMANAIAEKLAAEGCRVVYVTPYPEVAPYTHGTLEQEKIQQRLLSLDIEVRCARNLSAVDGEGCEIACVYTGRTERLDADAVVPVTSRLPNDALLEGLNARRGEFAGRGIKSVTAIGDALVPGSIAVAVYSGHQQARQMDNPANLMYTFKRENYTWPGARD